MDRRGEENMMDTSWCFALLLLFVLAVGAVDLVIEQYWPRQSQPGEVTNER